MTVTDTSTPELSGQERLEACRRRLRAAERVIGPGKADRRRTGPHGAVADARDALCYARSCRLYPALCRAEQLIGIAEWHARCVASRREFDSWMDEGPGLFEDDDLVLAA